MDNNSKSKENAQLNFTSNIDEQDIVDRIYAAVMEQRLSPNTKLSETKLCESFGVGRMRVRRALLILSSQGIVDLQSNRGAFIASPDQKEANEVFDARMHIEPSLVRQIAQNIQTANLTILRDHIDHENEARASKDRMEIIRLSGEFHVKLASIGGNSVLRRVIRELVTRTSLIVGLYGSEETSCCPDDEHIKILKAIEAKDADIAMDLVRSHLSHIQSGLNFSIPKANPLDLKQILGAH